MRKFGCGAAACSIAVSIAIAVSGCVGAPHPSISPTPTHSISAPTVSPSASPTPAPPSTPTFMPNGTAEQNLPYFNKVALSVLQQNANAAGPDLLNALAAAGFNRANMQYTNNRTSVNLPAGSFAFSVRIGNDCLIGQDGNGSLGYHSEVAPALQNGVCLIGQTGTGTGG